MCRIKSTEKSWEDTMALVFWISDKHKGIPCHYRLCLRTNSVSCRDEFMELETSSCQLEIMTVQEEIDSATESLDFLGSSGLLMHPCSTHQYSE